MVKTTPTTIPFSPSQYEHLVAASYRSKGYDAAPTPYSHDYGVDVFATKGVEKIAVQAKMFGQTGRPINREMVTQLHGAKDYFDCTRAAIVTNGRVKADAAEVAKKLGIDIQRLDIDELLAAADVGPLPAPSPFDDIWQRYIVPLAGKTITRPSGLPNTILSVDWSGLKRLSSKNNVSRLPIEIFRMAVEYVSRHGSITRSLINEEYPKRGASAVVLVLSQVPLFEYVAIPPGIRLKK